MVNTGIDYAAEFEREVAEWDRQQAARAIGNGKRRDGPSVVYSLRLEPIVLGEVELLARQLGLLNSELIRRFIRQGLSGYRGASAESVLDGIDVQLATLRALVADEKSRAGAQADDDRAT